MHTVCPGTQHAPLQQVPLGQHIPLNVPGTKHAFVPLGHGTHCPLLHTEFGAQQAPAQQS